MGILDLGRYRGIVVAITGFLIFIAAILALNHGKAGQFADNVVGVRVLTEGALQPTAIYGSGIALQQRLSSGEKIDEALEALRRSASSFEKTLGALNTGGMVIDAAGNTTLLPALNTPSAQAALAGGAKLWEGYKSRLDPILRFSGSPYTLRATTAQPGLPPEEPAPVINPDATRVQLSPRGRRLQAALEELSQYGSASHPQLNRMLASLANEVETSARRDTDTLRLIQVGGMAAALGLLITLFLYFARNLRKEEISATRTRKETQDILRTVNEGLFLLDKDLKIGSERSLALNDIFRREDFAGITFDQLLRDIVPDKTLRTAIDYVALLWGERVNEKLVKTINPLNEVEVHFDNPAGGFDTHFLEFDFNRVKSAGSLSHLLVTVNDVTKRVMLSQELQESQEKAQAQLDLLLRILHIEPDNLTGFLTDADVSLKTVNAILKEPAREESAFRAKIDSIYRQVHSVKGEASALGLKTVEQRAHAFEEALNELKDKPSLSGGDFLPLVVKLDDLFSHLAQVREMLSRLMDLHQAIASRSAAGARMGAEKVDQWLAGNPETTQNTPALNLPNQSPPGSSLERTLDDLTSRVAESQSKQVQLRCLGLEQVPESYRRAVKDITIQLVRNAVVHGIEAPTERSAANKTQAGTLSVEFKPRGTDGYELIVQDDGRGLQLERIKEVALARGIITAAQAQMLDPRQTMALIFRPGFSTAEHVTTDAGRGAGMDLVRILVAELGGRVGLASAGGKFSKFKIWLPISTRAAA